MKSLWTYSCKNQIDLVDNAKKNIHLILINYYEEIEISFYQEYLHHHTILHILSPVQCFKAFRYYLGLSDTIVYSLYTKYLIKYETHSDDLENNKLVLKHEFLQKHFKKYKRREKLDALLRIKSNSFM